MCSLCLLMHGVDGEVDVAQAWLLAMVISANSRGDSVHSPSALPNPNDTTPQVKAAKKKSKKAKEGEGSELVEKEKKEKKKWVCGVSVRWHQGLQGL